MSWHVELLIAIAEMDQRKFRQERSADIIDVANNKERLMS